MAVGDSRGQKNRLPITGISGVLALERQTRRQHRGDPEGSSELATRDRQHDGRVSPKITRAQIGLKVGGEGRLHSKSLQPGSLGGRQGKKWGGGSAWCLYLPINTF